MFGPGHHETVVRLGTFQGATLLTVTHRDFADLAPAVPSVAYLSQIAAGLQEAHGWGAERIGTYRARAPGVRGAWTADQISNLARSVA